MISSFNHNVYVNLVSAGAIPTKAAISACYDLFKLSKPDTYDQILRSWYRLRLMTNGGDTSVAKRARDFKKHTDTIEAAVSALSSFYCSKLIRYRFGMALATSALRASASLWAVS